MAAYCFPSSSAFFSLSPLCSSPPLHSHPRHGLSSIPHRSFLVLSSSRINARPSSSNDGETRLLLERYGLDSYQFTSEPTPAPQRSGRRSREEQMKLRKQEKKRRPLQMPPQQSKEKNPRQTTHRLLQVAGGCPASLRPGRWLDLYSGIGSVGIEAISRGCSEAHFVEMDPWVVSEVLRPNLKWTGFLDMSVIHTICVESFLEQAAESLGTTFDYISVTPPYTAVDYSTLLEKLGKSPLVGEDCFILVEYPLKTSISDSCGPLIKVADRRFGRTNLIIYGPEWAQKKRIRKNTKGFHYESLQP